MRRSRLAALLAAAGAVSTVQSTLLGANYTWATFLGGTYNWTEAANWTSAAPGAPAYPNLAGDSANISGALAGGNLNIALPGNVSVQLLTLGASGASPFTIDIGNSNSGGGKLIFDPASSITSVGISGSGNTITAPIQLNGNLGVASTSTNSLSILGPVQMNGGNRSFVNNIVSGATLTIGGNILLYDATVPATSRVLTLDGLGRYNITGSFVVGDGVTTGNTGTVIFGTNSGLVQGHIAISSDNSALTQTNDLRRTVLVLQHDLAVGTGSLLTNTAANNFMAEIQSNNDSRALKAQANIFRPLLVGGDFSLTLDNGILGRDAAPLVNLLAAEKSVTVNGNVYLWNANASRPTALIFDGPGTTVINGPVLNNNLLDTNSSALTKRGTGTLRLNSTANTYSGATNVQGGLLVFGANGAWGNTGGAGAGIFVSPGGAIWYAPGTGDTAGFTAMLNELLSNSTGALALPSSESGTDFDFNTATLTNAAGMTIGAQGSISYSGTVTPGVNGYGFGGGGTLVLSGTNRITGGNNVRYANGGIVVVTAAQDYTGITTIEGSILTTDQVRAEARVASGGASTLALSTVLQINSLTDGGTNSALGASSNDAANLVFNGGTLRVTSSGSTDRLFSIGTFGGTIDASGGAIDFTNPGETFSFGNGNRTLTLTGTSSGSRIQGVLGDVLFGSALSVAKTGSGQWDLDADNTYTGVTSVSAGTLRVNGTHSGGGSYTIAAGATLSGEGTISGQVNAASASILAPGIGVGVLTVGSLSLNSASLSFDINSTGADLLSVTSPDGLTLSGVSTFTIIDLGGVTTGTYPLIDYAGTALLGLDNFLLATTSLGGFSLSLLNNTADTSVDLVVGTGTGGFAASWNVDSDGAWSLGTNWTGNIAPNGIDHAATFGTIITEPRTVTVDAPQTVGAITFNNAATYTIGGASALTLQASSGAASINVLSGSHRIDAPVTLNSDVIVSSAASSGVAIGGNLVAAGRSITKVGAGSVQFENVRAASLTVGEGVARIRAKTVANDPAGTSVVNALGISPTGAQLDLTNNSLVIDYSGDVGSLVGDTRAHLQSNRITSSSATTTTRLGYGDNAVLNKTSFAGQTVDATSLLIKFTYGGDADLDGDVDVADLGALASNWQTSAVWTGGDFDYSGFVDVNDLGMLASNWQAGVGSPLGPSFQEALASIGLGNMAIPEPAGAMTIMSTLCGMLVRRRRR